MSRNTKIALAVVGGLVGVCCLVGLIVVVAAPSVLSSVFGDVVSSSPEEAAATGQEIAEYTLPAGYQEEAAINILNTKMVIIAGDNNNMALVMMQFPSSYNEEQMREQIQQSWGQQTGQSGTNMELIEERPITIRDQSTTLAIMEGTDANGNSVRQEFTSFVGENGLVMLMAVGEPESFDQDAVDSFLESIR